MNLVIVDERGEYTFAKKSHLGKPKEVLDELIKTNIDSGETFYGLCGSFGDISEISAIERGISSFNEPFDAILSLGGEAIVLYVLHKGKFIVNVLSHDKCAAGSGEFFIQQIDRLGITLEQAIKLAHKGGRVEIASRCSVHCKSDITHKLNRGEATVEDLLTSVLSSMVLKVKGLIIQSRMIVKRLLVIGGVTLNSAFIKLLKDELEEIEVVIKDVSPVFEAYGAALIVKESPINKNFELNLSKSFSTLPSLKQFKEKITIYEPTAYKTNFNENSTLLLGVDVGSTTTKAVVVDAYDSAILASYYGRTNGNPVAATKKCIEEIIAQIGNQVIHLVGVTGSGRALVGAYLGTSAVYNEISAHARGAIFYDPEVDTIFEIGGQDSKYLYLQNSVPVDYAMNATCSAGTGSFLEESAKGDLGVNVHNISTIAIEAKSPIRFKADCAAFINTDIRTALQEGYSSEDIIGGLVYSIIENYLNKVKGSRAVGKKIFFQGGVAKNHSIGFAFAQATGKEIIVPPHPELLGAFGIALIAKEKYEAHDINGMPNETTLELLIKPTLKHLGNFTCKSCKNYCKIERYQVANRHFSFGGSCTKYEHQWKQTEKTIEKIDLVQLRNFYILNNEALNKVIDRDSSKGKIGIPRALLTHSLYPLYSIFFKELGYEVILSDIDEQKELMTNAPFCYPIQILHGAILDLIKKDITTIFLPHVHNFPKGENKYESTFCPITQASPYFISTAFRNVTFLSPILDFTLGYDKDLSMIRLAVEKLNQPKQLAEEAYHKAINMQRSIERQFMLMGLEALENLKDTHEIGILLVGRSYNAFPPETSLKIPKKLASMGVTVIPFDFLERTSNDDIPWYFASYAKTAIDLVAKTENLFLLYINSFSCTIDAFSQNYLSTELSEKPYLVLELDAHTADAGIQTRLEAFLEIIKNYQIRKNKVDKKPFQVTKVKMRTGKVVVITSEGKELSIKDKRVKLFLPSFSKYHTDIGDKLLSLFGYNMGGTTDIKLEFPIKGLQCSSGKECIPLPVVLGQIMTCIENRKPGEILGFYMIRGGSPCAVYSYFQYIEQFLEKYQIKDVFIFRFDFLTKYLGMKINDVIRYVPSAIILGDIILEMESALEVIEKEGSLKMFEEIWNDFLISSTTIKKYRKNIKKLAKKLAKIPKISSPLTHPRVLISGDFFVRFSPFFLKELKDIYAKNGIIVKSSDLFELGIYSQSYLAGYLITKIWNKNPDDLLTFLRASATLWDHASRLLVMGKISIRLMLQMERRLRKRFKKTGLLYAQPNDLKEIFRLSNPLISQLIFGEAIPTIGKGMETIENNQYDSLILTGPFNCLPYKISQAILKPLYLEHQVPFLVFDADISAISPNMKRLIYANIEQIKRRREMNPYLAIQLKRRQRVLARVNRILIRRLVRRLKRIRKKVGFSMEKNEEE